MSGLFGAPGAKTANGTTTTTAPVVPVPAAFAPSPKNSLAQVGVRQGGRKLQPSKVGGGGPISILVQGSKDGSKSCSLAGLAALRPKGTRFVMASFDETTLKSLQNYYGAAWVDENVEVYELTRRVIGPDGKVLYAGFDPNEPATAEAVVGEFFLLLEELEKAGNVWGFVCDHFQMWWEGVCKSYAAHAAGYTSTAQLEIKDWGVRTDTGVKSESKIRRVVSMDGGIVAITGYAPEERVVVKKVGDANGRAKTSVVREIKSPPWLRDDIIRNWDVMLGLKVVREGVEATSTANGIAKDHYMVEVLTSKVRRFPKGATVNITGSSLAKFWEPETVEALADLVDGVEPSLPPSAQPSSPQTVTA